MSFMFRDRKETDFSYGENPSFGILKKVGFVEVEDKTPEESIHESFNKIIVECDICGNTTETCHFFCGEFLPISMYCIRCKKHVPAHAHYEENQK